MSDETVAPSSIARLGLSVLHARPGQQSHWISSYPALYGKYKSAGRPQILRFEPRYEVSCGLLCLFLSIYLSVYLYIDTDLHALFSPSA